MNNEPEVQVPEISAEDLRGRLERHEDVQVLDVRKQDERAEWWIPGSAHVDAFDALRAHDPSGVLRAAQQLPRGVPVVTVCGAGRTSKLAALALREVGVEAYSLAGGMRGWSAAWNTAPVSLPAGAPEVLQVRRTGKGCLSYLVMSAGQAGVIDPSVGPQVFVDLAAARGAKIVAVFDTHVHADHISRAHELGRLTGALVVLPEQQRVHLPFTPARDGDSFPVGDVNIRALRTPGHTRESTCYAIGEWALATGDTLFLGGVGRPDLAAANNEESRERARLLHQSLHQRIFPLPDATVILPGHTSEPLGFDGQAFAAPLAELREAGGLGLLDEAAFVNTLMERLPGSPPNHMAIVHINEGLEPAPADFTALEAGANRCAVRA